MTASAAAIVIIVVFLVLVALVGMHFMCRKTKNVPWGKNAGALSASTDCERDSTVVIPSAEDKNADALPTNTSSSETDNVRNLVSRYFRYLQRTPYTGYVFFVSMLSECRVTSM